MQARQKSKRKQTNQWWRSKFIEFSNAFAIAIKNASVLLIIDVIESEITIANVLEFMHSISITDFSYSQKTGGLQFSRILRCFILNQKQGIMYNLLS